MQSLSSGERDVLSVYRYPLTKPDSDSQFFRNKTRFLRDVIMDLDRELKLCRKYAINFPGYNEYYRADNIAMHYPRKNGLFSEVHKVRRYY